MEKDLKSLRVGVFAASLVEAILHILRSSASPHVKWAHTAPVVTGMADLVTLWNWAVKLFKDQSVRQRPSALPLLAPSDLRVAVYHQRTRIVPATGLQIDFNSQQYPLPRKEGFNYS